MTLAFLVCEVVSYNGSQKIINLAITCGPEVSVLRERGPICAKRCLFMQRAKQNLPREL